MYACLKIIEGDIKVYRIWEYKYLVWKYFTVKQQITGEIWVKYGNINKG